MEDGQDKVLRCKLTIEKDGIRREGFMDAIDNGETYMMVHRWLKDVKTGRQVAQQTTDIKKEAFRVSTNPEDKFEIEMLYVWNLDKQQIKDVEVDIDSLTRDDFFKPRPKDDGTF